MSNVLVGIDNSASFRFYVTNTTKMVQTAHEIHHTTPLAIAGLGRTLTGAGLMCLQMKNEQDRLTVQFRGDGPAEQILVSGYGDGRVRGYIANPEVDLPLKRPGKLDVGGSLGDGELTVVRDTGLKEPYVGRIALVSGEIAEDLTAYYYQSEQQNTSFALGVKVGTAGNVNAAGGLFIQMLPNEDPAAVDALENVLEHMPPITTIVEQAMLKSAGKSEEGILQEMLGIIFQDIDEAFAPQILEYKDIRWECDCSKQRMADALMTIGVKDLTTLIEEDGQAELGCHFCNSKYRFAKEELEAIRERAEKGPDGGANA